MELREIEPPTHWQKGDRNGGLRCHTLPRSSGLCAAYLFRPGRGEIRVFS